MLRLIYEDKNIIACYVLICVQKNWKKIDYNLSYLIWRYKIDS